MFTPKADNSARTRYNHSIEQRQGVRYGQATTRRPSALPNSSRTSAGRKYKKNTNEPKTSQTAFTILKRPSPSIDELVGTFVSANREFIFFNDEKRIYQVLSQLKVLVNEYCDKKQLRGVELLAVEIGAVKTLISLMDHQGERPLNPKAFQCIGTWLFDEMVLPAFIEAAGCPPKEAACKIHQLYKQLRALNSFRMGKLLVSLQERTKKNAIFSLAETFYHLAKLPFEKARHTLFLQAKQEGEGALQKLFLVGRLGSLLALGDPNPFFDLAAFAFFLLNDSAESLECLKAAEELDVAFLDNSTPIPCFLQNELVAQLRIKVARNPAQAAALEDSIREQNKYLREVQGRSLPARKEQYERIRSHLYPLKPVVKAAIPVTVLPLKPSLPFVTDNPSTLCAQQHDPCPLPACLKLIPSIEELPPLEEDYVLEVQVPEKEESCKSEPSVKELPPLIEDIVEEVQVKEKEDPKTLIKTWIQKGKRDEWPHIFKLLEGLSHKTSVTGCSDICELVELLAVNLTKKKWEPELYLLLKGYLPHISEGYWIRIKQNGAEAYFDRLSFLLTVFKKPSDSQKKLVEVVINHLHLWMSKKITLEAGKKAIALFEQLWLHDLSGNPLLQSIQITFLSQPVTSSEGQQVSLRTFLSESMNEKLVEVLYLRIKQFSTPLEAAVCMQLFLLVSVESKNIRCVLKGLMLLSAKLPELLQFDESPEVMLQKAEMIELFVALLEHPLMNLILSEHGLIRTTFCVLGLRAAKITALVKKEGLVSEKVFQLYLKLFNINEFVSLPVDDKEKKYVLDSFKLFLEDLLSGLDSTENLRMLKGIYYPAIMQGFLPESKQILTALLRHPSVESLHLCIEIAIALAFTSYEQSRFETLPLEICEKILEKIQGSYPYEGWQSNLYHFFVVLQRHYKLAQNKEDRKAAKKLLNVTFQCFVSCCIKEANESDFELALEMLKYRAGISSKKLPSFLNDLYQAAKQNQMTENLRGRFFGQLVKYEFLEQAVFEKEIAPSFSKEEKEMSKATIKMLEGEKLSAKARKGKSSPFFKAALIECFIEVIDDKSVLDSTGKQIDPVTMWQVFTNLPQIIPLVKPAAGNGSAGIFGKQINDARLQFECAALQMNLPIVQDSFNFFLTAAALNPCPNPALLQKLHRTLLKRLVTEKEIPLDVRGRMILELFEKKNIDHLYANNVNGYVHEAFKTTLKMMDQGAESILFSLNILRIISGSIPANLFQKFNAVLGEKISAKLGQTGIIAEAMKYGNFTLRFP